jgi:hypothetical protein
LSDVALQPFGFAHVSRGPSAMTSKARSQQAAQLASQDDAKPLREAMLPEAASGNLHSYRDETRSSRATQREVASYIEGLAADLRAMARSADLDSLAYFLEMARLEASIQRERLQHAGTGDGAG